MSQPGHGAITVTVSPNPIVAQQVSGSTYEFPFDIIVRETGGHAVTINNVSVNVFAFGGIPVGSDRYDASRISSLGFATIVPPNGELRYHMHPRQSVTDIRLFNGVSAEVRVDATDDTGVATNATTRVTVRR